MQKWEENFELVIEVEADGCYKIVGVKGPKSHLCRALATAEARVLVFAEEEIK